MRQNGQGVFFFPDLEGGVAAPGLRTCVSDVCRNRKFPLSAGEVGHRVDINPLHKCLWRNQQAHRAENAPVICPVARRAARNHVLAEGIVHTYRDGIDSAPVE